jgi:hypothetical protein
MKTLLAALSLSIALAGAAHAVPKKPAKTPANSDAPANTDAPQMKGAKCGPWKKGKPSEYSRTCTYTERVVQTKGGGV